VWFIGARGAVATTTAVGWAALTRGLIEPLGLVTESPALLGAPVVDLSSLVLGGHDCSTTPLREAALGLVRDVGPLDRDLVRALDEALTAIDARIRPAQERRPGEPLRALVGRLQDSLRAFARAEGLSRVIVVNVATTEAPAEPHPAQTDLAALEAALDAPQAPLAAQLPDSVLYAYGALDGGFPYVNFTPSLGAACPALEALARARGVPHAGRDGKTGETLLKSALAPMFRMRHLRVRAWAGYNLLGNADGRALADPSQARSKLRTKGDIVPAILGPEAQSLVGIDYVPALGDWKTALDLVRFEGFLGVPMTLQLTWQGSDSALAAPLVLDLVRLVELAQRRGESGALGHLAFFFKSPLGCDIHDLAAQHARLVEHVRGTA
jgi:myo-inositol-1-phosphate synthase